MANFILRDFNTFDGNDMYIQPIGIYNISRQVPVYSKSQVSQPCFGGGGDFLSREIPAVKSINEILSGLYSPLIKSFISDEKTYFLNVYNKFHNPTLPKLDISGDSTPKFLLSGVGDYNLEVSQFVNRKQKHLELTFLQDGKEPLSLVFMNGFTANKKAPAVPISEREVRDYNLAETLPVVQDTLSEFLALTKSVVKGDLGDYTKSVIQKIISKTSAVDAVLSNLETGKLGAVKRSFKNYIQFPNKKVYFFKESDSVGANRYAFIPHRDGDERFFRLVEYDMQGSITDAYLLDAQKGVVKNYCPQRVFNIANISHTPPRKRYMTNDEIAASPVVKNLEKYFNVLDSFEEHVLSSMAKSVKTLDETANFSDYISFNKLKQEFTSRLPYVWRNDAEPLSVTGKDGMKYTLAKAGEFLNLTYDTRYGERFIKFNPENSKIMQTTLNGDILRDKGGNPLYYNHYSDTFKMKSKILKSFITSAFEQCKPETNTTLGGVGEKFKEVRAFWDGVSATKKTAVKKDYPAMVEARGDVGGLRFRISSQDYQIGLKPHRLNSDEFMRLTVYDKDGNIKKAFLIKDFESFVHNYCLSGNYTKDAISRVPSNIVYKTEEQLEADGLKNYLNQYLKELTDFKKYLEENVYDHRLANLT